MRIAVLPHAFSPEADIARFCHRRGADAGALATFVGYCRAQSGGADVTQLELQHYPGFTEAEVRRLAEAVAGRHDLIDLLVVHRVGVIPAGEPIVLVAALSAHRAAAFKAVEELMDYLKTDAPIWKRESGPAGARWIEPTERDRARRASHGETE
ncbi:MAG TPA: molybdenum cofactor biosynthesis protein MoaE [Vitreimonas sp.]|uniref:molybdenum cofactor biosynthesis protein MoaE n=1 Tax=Vitreimonas sp. TaxID=3069702 RepID=UPI002D4EDE8A|nr:molybdenum cofactor biosynthesis protein MoaE [Vitreimonas sp.]HYD89296.1 molybdenum cofactor biosynthesis protein MoaE [Vitreimonas sp.]